MKNFDWNEFKTGTVGVHCDTEEKANDFVALAHEHGLKWGESENSLRKESHYNYCTEDTCYVLIGKIIKSLQVWTASYYKNKGCKIIEWEIDNMKEFTEKDLKVGMLVETKCGDRAIVMPKDNELVLSYHNGYWDNVTFSHNLGCSIVKVWSSYHRLDFSGCFRAPLWEYEGTDEMTLEAVCKELGKNIKIIK